MPVAEFPALHRGLRVNSYAGALFACNFKRNKAYQMLNINSTLRYEEWQDLDRTVIQTGKEVLSGVMHLRGAAGLVRNVSIATSIAQYSVQGEMPPPVFAMNPLAEGERARVDFAIAGVPIPFAFNDFQLDIRTLMASRQSGEGLDVVQAAEASYQVALAWETMLFDGTPAIAVADRIGTLNTIYGYTTHPNRNTGVMVGPWDDPTNGYVNAINSIQAMKATLRNDRHYGPYWMYLNDQTWTDLGTINTNTDARIFDVIRADPELAMISYSNRLPAGEVVMVDPKPSVVQWVEAASIRTVEWDEKGSLGSNFRVIGAAAPLIKATSTGQSGIAHFTGAVSV